METQNKELDRYKNIKEIQALIDGKVMESLILDYKRPEVLDKNKRDEISKAVSAFANSDGGTIIYGIGETNHLPEDNIYWIENVGQERETLENVILSTIHPKIKNFKIHAIKNPEDDSKGILVVNILQSDTAHMASNKRYHRRRNFKADPMEDYEVRDIMFRHKKPDIDIVLIPPRFEEIYVGEKDFSAPSEIEIEVFIRNSGSVIAKHISGGFIFPGGTCPSPLAIHNRDRSASYQIRYKHNPFDENEKEVTTFDCDSRLMYVKNYADTKHVQGITALHPLISLPNTSISIGKISLKFLMGDYKSGIIKYWIIAEDMELKEGKFELSIIDDKIHIEKSKRF